MARTYMEYQRLLARLTHEQRKRLVRFIQDEKGTTHDFIDEEFPKGGEL